MIDFVKEQDIFDAKTKGQQIMNKKEWDNYKETLNTEPKDNTLPITAYLLTVIWVGCAFVRAMRSAL